jgi:hypothetical protein
MITKLQTTCIYAAVNKKSLQNIWAEESKEKGDYLNFVLSRKSEDFDFIFGSWG